jgi:hypothetical protein
MTPLQQEPGGKAHRLEFQKQAARIQLDASHLLEEVGRRLRRLHDTPLWTREDSSAAAAWPAEYRRLLDAWDALSPPEKLRPDWESVARAARDLEPLLDDVASLRGQTPVDLPHRISALQGAIGRQLAVMNRQEAALLAHEKAVAAEERLEDERVQRERSRAGR